MKWISTVFCLLAIGCATPPAPDRTRLPDKPEATVTVYVRGEVVRPGSYTLSCGSGVLHGIAAAGGLTEYASNSVFLRRNNDVAFDATIRDLERGEVQSPSLQTGDVIVVMSK